MRKSLKLLAAATLLLPGCILVTKDWDDEEDPFHSRGSLERRVAELEEQMAACKAACPMPCCNEQAAPAEAAAK